ncbi:putative glucosylceramidase 4 [Watersipora subatra]|uniref:putative glucosylceramidase 4 n=1 Tax=Watersipora subatra TaxID=2589382 RepID=UPI00355BBB6F
MAVHSLILVVAGMLLTVQDVAGTACDPVSFGQSSIVCRCNATYCDTVPGLSLSANTYTIYTSSMTGNRFSNKIVSFTDRGAMANSKITVNKSISYQTILGFGGAITDAAAKNIFMLSSATRLKLLESYYSPSGIEYTLGRIPIASTDFSTHAYSYDDIDGDLDLRHFALVTEDLTYKIPVVKSAQLMSSRKIKLFSSPWSAPYWMKTDESMTGRGFLIGQPGGPYYKAWAKYIVKFLDEYKKQGVEFWGLTAQNEPLDGRIPFFPFQCLGFTAEMQRDFIISDLGPALHAGGYADLNLMVFDDSVLEVSSWAKTIYDNETASQYVSGLALHWYENGVFGYNEMTDTHNINPSKFLLATEACTGSSPLDKQKVILGSWERAEQYTDDIIKDLQNWVTGWTDWNIALNMSGGPNWVNNNVDSPIIVNAVHNEFYKQPMYYAMGHFSKFVTPGSIRHEMSIKGSACDGVVFSTPEGYTAMILYNRSETAENVDVVDGNKTFTVSVAPRSINTVVYLS